MNQVFVLNSAVYCHDGTAAITTLDKVDTLAVGSLAIFQEDGIKVTDLGVFDKSAQFATMYAGVDSELGIKKSNRINLDTLTMSKQAYVAPVASIKHIGYNGVDGAMNMNTSNKTGSYYGIAFIDLTKPTYERRRFEVSLTTVTDDMTVATAVANLIPALIANPNINDALTSIVTQGTTGIKFTGIAGKNFEVVGVGLLESATKTDDGNFLEGCNSYEWAKTLETNESTVEGMSGALESAPDVAYTIPSQVVAGANYTVYTLNWSWVRSGYNSANASNNEHAITILVPASNVTMIASIDAIGGDIIG